MSKWLLAAAVSLASLGLAGGAHASTLFFQYTEAGGIEFLIRSVFYADPDWL